MTSADQKSAVGELTDDGPAAFVCGFEGEGRRAPDSQTIASSASNASMRGAAAAADRAPILSEHSTRWPRTNSLAARGSAALVDNQQYERRSQHASLSSPKCLLVGVLAAPAHAQILRLTDMNSDRLRARPRQNRGGHCRRSAEEQGPIYHPSQTGMGAGAAEPGDV